MAKKSTSEEIKDVIMGVQRTGESRGALWISSGSTLADIVIGAGQGMGYETGEVVLIEAQSGGGKTFLGHEIVANAYHQYKDLYPGKFKHEYVDKEAGATFDSQEMFGLEIVPTDLTKRVRPKHIQELYASIMSFLQKLKPDEYGVHVTDSLNGFFDEKGAERSQERVIAYDRGREFEEKTMGMELSKFLSQTFFKGICPAVEESNALMVIIAQYRQKQLPSGGVYFDLQMGEALKFFVHKRVKITVAEDIVVKGRQIGTVIKVETKKARGKWPYRHAFVTMYFDTGIDNVTSNIDYLYDLRTETGKLSAADKKQVLLWDGQEFNREGLVRHIEANDLEEDLASRVIARWNAEEEVAASIVAGRKKRF